MVQLSDHGRMFRDRSVGHCAFVACESADGKETLDGVHLIPRQFVSTSDTPKKPLPKFVLLHGGPYASRTDAFDAWDPLTFITPLLLAKGFAVLMPNYRSSSGRGHQFASYTRGGMGIYDEPDVVSLTQHLVAQYAGRAPWAAADKPDASSRSGSAIWEFREAAEVRRIPPLLILRGQEDRRVPVSQAHGFRRALDQAGLMDQTEFVTFVPLISLRNFPVV
ncbi:hypothetical protein PG994_012753 [Apiospora phragmitis]|uniref:Dipeptidyl-peptidase V n=1 Tax=Apiospora phragmitis TaxID=2905665 RepID=A0ABR1TBB7_9PEZI